MFLNQHVFPRADQLSLSSASWKQRKWLWKQRCGSPGEPGLLGTHSLCTAEVSVHQRSTPLSSALVSRLALARPFLRGPLLLRPERRPPSPALLLDAGAPCWPLTEGAADQAGGRCSHVGVQACRAPAPGCACPERGEGSGAQGHGDEAFPRLHLRPHTGSGMPQAGQKLGTFLFPTAMLGIFFGDCSNVLLIKIVQYA